MIVKIDKAFWGGQSVDPGLNLRRIEVTEKFDIRGTVDQKHKIKTTGQTFDIRNTEAKHEVKVDELEATISDLKAELISEADKKEDLLDKLEQCIEYASTMKNQRDEAMATLKKVSGDTGKSKIVLPGHVDSDGNSKIIL